MCHKFTVTLTFDHNILTIIEEQQEEVLSPKKTIPQGILRYQVHRRGADRLMDKQKARCLGIRLSPRGIKTTYSHSCQQWGWKPEQRKMYVIQPFYHSLSSLCSCVNAALCTSTRQPQKKREGKVRTAKEMQKCLLFCSKHWSKRISLVTIRGSKTKRGEKHFFTLSTESQTMSLLSSINTKTILRI